MIAMHVIDFNADGSVESLHNDKLTLDFLGQQHVERVSEIVFSDDKQKWYITIRGYTGRFYKVDEAGLFGTYEEARKLEVVWLNACRLNECIPLSVQGRQLAKACLQSSLVN